MSWNGEDLFRSVLLGSASSGGGSSGGGGGSTVTPSVQPKEVNFYDYDGTLLHAYTVAQAQALTELPAGPEHPGLVFQGWNWSLENVKALTRAMNIGAMYTTDDGTTRLYITLQEGRTSPMLGVGVNGTVTVDWGDGTEPDVLTGTSAGTTKWTPNHAYAAPGDYVIRLTVEGEMAFTGDSSASCILRYSSSYDNRNQTYQSALQKVEAGSGVTRISGSAFYNCYSLASITIPEGVTSIGTYAFNKCYSLASVTIPEGVTSIGTYAFNKCHSLASVTIPEGVTSIDNYVFDYCYSLASVAIPEGVTRISGSAFYNCYALASITIPEGVTSIGGSAFYNCYSLASVTIPDGVTSIPIDVFNSCFSFASVDIPGSLTHIGSRAFDYCYGVAFYDFTACAAVPVLGATDAFTGIPDDCEIRVPAALYDEWIAATNWATYADYIKAY